MFTSYVGRGLLIKNPTEVSCPLKALKDLHVIYNH